MRISCCDICGKKIPFEVREEVVDRRSYSERTEGAFSFTWFPAIVNSAGEVTGHAWGTEPDLCPNCAKYIDDAIFEAIEDLREYAPASRKITLGSKDLDIFKPKIPGMDPSLPLESTCCES